MAEHWMDDPEFEVESDGGTRFYTLLAVCFAFFAVLWGFHEYWQAPRPVFQLNPPSIAYLHNDEYGAMHVFAGRIWDDPGATACAAMGGAIKNTTYTCTTTKGSR